MDGSALEDGAVLQNKQPECKSLLLLHRGRGLFWCLAFYTYSMFTM